MQLFRLFALAATATAAVLPDGLLEKRATTCSVAGASTLSAAAAAFTSAKIVPDLIPIFHPTVAVMADYQGKQVKLGNKFNTVQTAMEPTINFTAESKYDPATTKYTIFLVDPDAPSPSAPVLKDFLHLIISDAQPACIATQMRKTVASYMSPTPLSVAPHRYTFVVYRQPPNYVPPPDVHYAPGVRNNFDLNSYVAEAGLMGPVGGNFFREGLAQDVCLVTPGCTQ